MSGALWFVPAAFGLQSVVLLNEVTPTGYVQSDYAQAATFGLYPTAPLLAAVAAVSFRGFRRFHLQAPQLRRLVVARAFAPLLVGSAAAVLTAMALRVRSAPEDPRTLAILALAVMTVLACGLWGLAMGRAFPTALAVPLAAAAPFWWIAVTPTLNGGIYRHLSPEVLCCRVDTQLSPTYLFGIGSLAGLLLVGLGALFVPRAWSALPWSTALAVVLAATATAVATSILLVRTSATPVPLSITETRTTSLTCATSHSLPVCVWPEQAPSISPLASEVQQLNTWFRERGMSAVAGVNQRAPADGEIAVRTAQVGFETVDELRIFVAAAYVSREAHCADGLHGDRAADERVAALAIAMGWRPEQHPDDFPPETVKAASAAVADGPAGFAGWFRGGLDQIRCASPR